MLDVDVVIVSYQSADHIDRATGQLAGIAKVVVVDNASTDATARRAQQAGATTVINDVNLGFAAAANQGARLGNAPAILFLNPDAAIAPDDVTALARDLDDNPALAIVSPRVRYEDGSEQRVLWAFPSSPGAWREAVGLHRVRPRPVDEGFVTGTCFMIRRAAFAELGGLDARFWLYGEETDLCRRAIDSGWGVMVDQAVMATHVGSGSRRTAPALVDEHFARGTERFIADREGTGGLVSYRIANIVGAAIRAAVPGSPCRRSAARARLRRYANALARHPSTVPLDSPAMAHDDTIVLCSLEPWDDVWRRNQFIVRELLARDPQLRVLFVEPPFELVHSLQGQHLPRRRGLRPVVADGRVVALQPLKLVPRVLGPFADSYLRRQVVRTAARIGFRSPVLWINDPCYADLVYLGWPSLYDITDDLTQMNAPPRVVKRVARWERTLLERADAVTVCSADLARTRDEDRPDLEVIPNAVDASHFVAPKPRPTDLAPSPVAVYLGTLHEDRLDIALVAELAAASPNLHITLVGPDALNDEARQVFRALPNVSLLGARPYEEVPAYLQHADVVIVPHVVSPFTESLDPIKAYECVAVGRPTVATPVAGFRGLGGAIAAVDRDRFVETVHETLANPRPSGPRAAASWTERARAFRAALDRTRAAR